MTTPIPQDLLDHPAINDHPHIRALHQEHGGVPPDADPAVVEEALSFANAVANHAVEPGTKTRRTDPSPRRTARVWRAEILGRDTSVSPERERERDLSTSGGSGSELGSELGSSIGSSVSPARARYRSRSRPPTTLTVKEEPDEDVRTQGARTPGRRDWPFATTAVIQLEHRVATMVQQQHEFHERVMRRVNGMDKKVEQAEARNTNKINAYLSRPLVPVSNGRDGVPPALKPLTSLEAIRTLAREDVDKWLEYYTGARGGGVDEQGARQALRACVGVDVSML